MDWMFTNAGDLKYNATDTPNMSNVNSMKFTFYNTSFNGNINNWDTGNVKDMSWMFAENSEFNQSLNEWNTSNVTDMNGMFMDAFKYNQPMDNWDTSNVTDMRSLLFNTRDFNQNISTWCVEKIDEKPTGFDYNSDFEDNNEKQPNLMKNNQIWVLFVNKNILNMINKITNINQNI